MLAPVVAHLSRSVVISGADITGAGAVTSRQSMSEEEQDFSAFDGDEGDDEEDRSGSATLKSPYAKLDAWLDGGLATSLGGHVVVMHSAESQVVTGVELVGLAVPGVSGRYPLDMPFFGNVSNDTLVEGNVIHHSKQRAIIIHATHNARVSDTVAFCMAGHVYMVEDRIEKQTSLFITLA